MKDKELLRDKEDILLKKLLCHVGEQNSIGLGELYEMVFNKTWAHRQNDTRELRFLITSLRRDGVPICSKTSGNGGGYWIAVGQELEDYCMRLRSAALKKLALESKLRKTTLPVLLGNIQLGLEAA